MIRTPEIKGPVHALHPIANKVPEMKIPGIFFLVLCFILNPGNPFPSNIITPKNIIKIPATIMSQPSPPNTSSKDFPDIAANTPIAMKTVVKPKKKMKVDKVLFFPDWNVTAK